MESTLKNLGIVVQNVLLANVTLKFLFWNMANTSIFFTEKKCEQLTFLQQTYQCTTVNELSSLSKRCFEQLGLEKFIIYR